MKVNKIIKNPTVEDTIEIQMLEEYLRRLIKMCQQPYTNAEQKSMFQIQHELIHNQQNEIINLKQDLQQMMETINSQKELSNNVIHQNIALVNQQEVLLNEQQDLKGQVNILKSQIINEKQYNKTLDEQRALLNQQIQQQKEEIQGLNQQNLDQSRAHSRLVQQYEDSVLQNNNLIEQMSQLQQENKKHLNALSEQQHQQLQYDIQMGHMVQTIQSKERQIEQQVQINTLLHSQINNTLRPPIQQNNPLASQFSYQEPTIQQEMSQIVPVQSIIQPQQLKQISQNTQQVSISPNMNSTVQSAPQVTEQLQYTHQLQQQQYLPQSDAQVQSQQQNNIQNIQIQQEKQFDQPQDDSDQSDSFDPPPKIEQKLSIQYIKLSKKSFLASIVQNKQKNVNVQEKLGKKGLQLRELQNQIEKEILPFKE